MAEIKLIRWTSVDTWRYLRRSMKIERKAITRLHRVRPSAIKGPRFKRNGSPSCT